MTEITFWQYWYLTVCLFHINSISVIKHLSKQEANWYRIKGLFEKLINECSQVLEICGKTDSYLKNIRNVSMFNYECLDILIYYSFPINITIKVPMSGEKLYEIQ